ncbi:glycosyltransferase [Arcobacter sp. YIC-310]|uniref:glycosyltransferase n=1 Tax=Arcobacter sp. YIC-310 TaxID=3376632 RepID=UPI003C1FA716
MTKVFFINSLSDGGAERVVLTLCKGFLKENYNVHLILIYKSNANAYELPDDIIVHYLFEDKPKDKVEKLLLLPKAVKKLKEVITKIEKDDKIDLFTSHLQLSNYVAWLSKVKNHYGVIHSNYSKKYSGIMKIIISLILKSKKLIAVSEGVKDDLVRNFTLNKDNIVTIYNPFDINYIRQQSIEKIEYEKPYIIHVGRLLKLKRQDLLINAYNQSDIKDKYNLIILGDGEERNILKQQIKKLGIEQNVQLLGWQSNPYKWIKNASLFVLCSEYEGLPTVLIESLICETAVISTNCKSGPSEILIDDLSYYLVPVDDMIYLSKKIEEALDFYPKIEFKYYERFKIETIVSEYKKLGVKYEKTI